MNTLTKWILGAVLVLAALAGGTYLLLPRLLPAPAAAAELDPEKARVAGEFLDHLDAGRFDGALALTTPTVREALGAGKLEQIWTALPGSLGGLKSRGPLRGESVDGTPVVTSTLVFGYASLDARVVVGADGAISGFRIVPAAQASEDAPAPAPLASTEHFSEIAVRVGEGDEALDGTLTRPTGNGPFAAVVLVHGSGPHDRDETIGPNKPFLDLAHGLARRGIAVLRYEKRSKARPQDFGNAFDVNTETVDDAVAAVALLRAHADIDAARVFVAGHSLGGMMAPRIAQRAPEVAGLILLAAPARPMQEAYLEQIEFLAGQDGSVTDAEREAINHEHAKAAAIATLTIDSSAETLLGLPASYWIDLRDYDPVALAQALTQPMLILQGARDYQVTVAADLGRWRAAFDGNARATIKEYAGLNHLFMQGEGAPNPQEYFAAGQVSAQVIDDIAAWVNAPDVNAAPAHPAGAD